MPDADFTDTIWDTRCLHRLTINVPLFIGVLFFLLDLIPQSECIKKYVPVQAVIKI